MSKKVINAQDFIKKATRVIEIPGFVEGETFAVRIKPVSLLSMVVKGAISNELLSVVIGLFDDKQSESGDDLLNSILDDSKLLGQVDTLMKKVVKDVLLEPTFDEIGDYLTDEQIQSIFNQAQGNIQELKPSDGK